MKYPDREGVVYYDLQTAPDDYGQSKFDAHWFDYRADLDAMGPRGQCFFADITPYLKRDLLKGREIVIEMDDERFAYVARCACGDLIWGALDEPDSRKYIGKLAAQSIEEGLVVERLPLEEAKAIRWCEEHGDHAEKEPVAIQTALFT